MFDSHGLSRHDYSWIQRVSVKKFRDKPKRVHRCMYITELPAASEPFRMHQKNLSVENLQVFPGLNVYPHLAFHKVLHHGRHS